MKTAKMIKNDLAFAKNAMLKSKKNFLIGGLIITVFVFFFPLIIIPTAIIYHLVILRDDEKEKNLNIKDFFLKLIKIIFFSIINAFSLVFKAILILTYLKNLDPPHYTHES